MPLGVKSANKPIKEFTDLIGILDEEEDETITSEDVSEWKEALHPTKPHKPRYAPHDDLVEILRNCHRRFKDWRYGHLLQVCERLMTHFGIGEGE